MNRQQNWLCLPLAVFVSAMGMQNAGRCQGDEPTFYATVHERFSRWDTNGDGILTEDEIVRAFQSPHCRGSHAAAIAVLQRIETGHIIKKTPLETFTLEQFNDMEAGPKHGHDKYQSTFEQCLKKINAKPKELFSHDVPEIDNIVQGHANDCYLLSVVASLAHQRPRELMRLIEDNNDGSYTVHFFGEEPVKVACLTDGEFSAYNSTQDGLWLPVLIKAYGKWKLRNSWHNPKATPIHEDPVEAVAIHGGNCGSVVKLFSGRAVKTHKPKEIANNLRQRLSRAFDEHRMVFVGVPGHVMAALAFDRQSDQVKIWNPWGSNGEYKVLDVEMQHGFFAMPVSDFIEKCSHVTFELAENAPPDSGASGKKRGGGRDRRRG